MSRILVKKSNDKYQLFCNTLDCFCSPLITKADMVHYLTNTWVEKHTRNAALNRVNYMDEDSYYNYAKCLKMHNENADAELKSALKKIYNDNYKKGGKK